MLTPVNEEAVESASDALPQAARGPSSTLAAMQGPPKHVVATGLPAAGGSVFASPQAYFGVLFILRTRVLEEQQHVLSEGHGDQTARR